MRIVLASSEVAPFSKTGGLGDVAGSLPAALARLGHEVVVFTPFYKQVEESRPKVRTLARLSVPLGNGQLEAEILESHLPSAPGVRVLFVARNEFYGRKGIYGQDGQDYPDNLERFAFFCRAMCQASIELELNPHIFHLNDWQTALAAAYLKIIYGTSETLSEAAVLFTIHNLGYQGSFAPWKMPITGLDSEHFNWLEMEFYGQINLLKSGLVYSDAISTVSKRYAQEIQTPDGGYGLDGVLLERHDSLFGIVNGLDYSTWDPATDKLLPTRYKAGSMAGKALCSKALRRQLGMNEKRSRPILGMVTRLAEQKGLDIFIPVVSSILDLGVDIAILGNGEERFEEALTELSDRNPGRIGLKIGYDERLSHLVEAGSDFYLMPSRYEPCGLNQLISLKYGNIPIVRQTGGLADTVTDGVNGFSFLEYDPQSLLVAVRRAVAAKSNPTTWSKMVAHAMSEDWSWDRSAQEYLVVYSLARSAKGLAPAGAPRRKKPSTGRKTSASRAKVPKKRK